MVVETEITSYLCTYGNTKEDDLAHYVARSLGKSSKTAKRILDQMVSEGKIRRLVHDKLERKAVYLTIGENLPYKTLTQLETGVLPMNDRGKPKIHEEAIRILQEAAILAEKRIKEKFSDSRKG